jgi:hypothetical protein
VLTASTRGGAPLETNVRRPVIYGLYGGAFCVPVVLLGFALFSERRRRDSAPAETSGEYG